MKLFANEEVNTGRQPFLDIAKTLAIFWMVMVHIFEEFSVFEEGQFFTPAAPIFGRLLGCILAGVFAAPTFMFAMGVGVAYSRSQQVAPMARRGVSLFTKAYLLNIFRWALPMAALSLLVPKILVDGPNGLLDTAKYAFDGDILHFAGATFLLLALLRYLRVPAWGMVALALAMSVTGGIVRGVDLGNPVLNYVALIFVGVDSDNASGCFPLLNWFIFPAAGLLFGGMLRRCTSTNRLFGIITPIALAVFVPLTIWFWRSGSGIFGQSELSFYHMGVGDALYVLTGVFGLLGVLLFAVRFVPGWMQSACGAISKAINEIYIVQWLIVDWAAIALQQIMGVEFGPSVAVAAAIPVFGVSCLLACRWRKSRAS